MPGLAYNCAQFVYSRLRTAKNQALNLLDAPVIVLLYHRVTRLPSDPQMLAVTPDNFRSQLRHLKEHFPLVRFEDDWSESPRPAVCITFDDGYADNALEALPILEELGVPATFFVSTGTIGTQQEFWWDELERIVLGEKELPSSFRTDRALGGKAWPTGTDSERREFYGACVQCMVGADAHARADLLARLRDWARSGAADAGDDRALSLDELKRLSASSMVTIGAHTVTHAQLSSLAPAAQKDEIVHSKRQLEAWLGSEISVFSYPYGKRSQYTRETVALCREAGFQKTAANFPGQAHRWSDPFQIPRHLVRNWPPEEFARRLEGFWTR